MLHQGSVRASSEWNKRNLTLTLILNVILPSIAFHNIICVFIMIFKALSFLRVIHGLYFIGGGNSVRLYVSKDLF